MNTTMNLSKKWPRASSCRFYMLAILLFAFTEGYSVNTTSQQYARTETNVFQAKPNTKSSASKRLDAKVKRWKKKLNKLQNPKRKKSPLEKGLVILLILGATVATGYIALIFFAFASIPLSASSVLFVGLIATWTLMLIGCFYLIVKTIKS
ncbi:MAG: hypothetical protein R2792_17175 [Saprospiraceae bacterium]